MGERASSARMRLAGKVCCSCKSTLPAPLVSLYYALDTLRGFAPRGRSIRISSRAVSTDSVDVHVCVVCRLFPVVRLNCLDLGAPIDRVLVHRSEPVFSEFGASTAATHSGPSFGYP